MLYVDRAFRGFWKQSLASSVKWRAIISKTAVSKFSSWTKHVYAPCFYAWTTYM